MTATRRGLLRAALAAACLLPATAEAQQNVVVAFGDSITKGLPDPWPDMLQPLLAQRGWSVVNAGIPGNRLLRGDVGNPSGLTRFDRDALGVAGVRIIVLLEGINDIGRPDRPNAAAARVSAQSLIDADRTLIARAHAHGVKILGGTLTPFAGAAFPGYYTAEGDAVRQQLNDWIRTGGAFDGVIDFDLALRDPADPKRLRAKFDSGDHLHPSRAGEAAMAETAAPSLLDYAISP